MRTLTVTPTGVERHLAPEEFIVSKTDPKGLITYVNDVFCRLAAYSEEDLIGRPHNLIRHPDMPRCVFKLLWDTIVTGREIFAYVVNLAADGAHYWVFAHVTASYDRRGYPAGYHSNRRAPAPEAIAAIVPLYAALREEEQRHGSSSAGLAAGTAMLQGLLTERGVTYSELVWGLTP